MAAIRTTRRLLAAYADKEPWKVAHDETQSCLDIEEKLGWGVHLFRGLLGLEARAQSHPPTNLGEATLSLEVMPMLYQLWLDASEFFLATARGFAQQGYDVDGLAEFEATVEEARYLCANLELEDEIRPLEALQESARPENPRPSRYRD